MVIRQSVSSLKDKRVKRVKELKRESRCIFVSIFSGFGLMMKKNRKRANPIMN
jgi:hypothetical protein